MVDGFLYNGAVENEKAEKTGEEMDADSLVCGLYIGSWEPVGAVRIHIRELSRSQHFYSIHATPYERCPAFRAWIFCLFTRLFCLLVYKQPAQPSRAILATKRLAHLHHHRCRCRYSSSRCFWSVVVVIVVVV